jgi:hypothetical protein
MAKRYQPSLAYLSQREIDTIIAALRFWQEHGGPKGSMRLDLLDISDNGREGDDARLSDEEIDELIEERINV